MATLSAYYKHADGVNVMRRSQEFYIICKGEGNPSETILYLSRAELHHIVEKGRALLKETE